MDKIILTDGTEIRTDFFVHSAGRVQFTAYDLTMMEAAQIFADPTLTAAMSVKGENNYFQIYTGFTKLTVLIMQGDHIKISLEEVL